MSGVMTSSTLPHRYPRDLAPQSNVGYQSIIGSTRLHEGQALLKYQSPVYTCLTMELDINLEVSPLSWKDTLQHYLYLP